MNCPICNTHTPKVAYCGPMRGGSTVTIMECRSCHVQFHPGALKLSDYQSGSYRDSVGHDMHGDTLDKILPFSEYAGKTVMDVGCGAGGMLNALSNAGAVVYGIEPDDRERAALSDRFNVFESLDAAKHIKADLILCLTVLEHVEKPVEFLSQISTMLNPNGRILITTPNRNSLLMRLLEFDYCEWFYRPAHRWYWDAPSLEKTLNLAGLTTTASMSYEPYGFGNFIHWMMHKQPAKGWSPDLAYTDVMDIALKAWESELGAGHYLLNVVTKGKTQ